MKIEISVPEVVSIFKEIEKQPEGKAVRNDPAVPHPDTWTQGWNDAIGARKGSPVFPFQTKVRLLLLPTAPAVWSAPSNGTSRNKRFYNPDGSLGKSICTSPDPTLTAFSLRNRLSSFNAPRKFSSAWISYSWMSSSIMCPENWTAQ